jgi:hypothetical protein
MTSGDVGTFDRAFRRVLRAYPVQSRLKPDDVETLCRTYFRVLDTSPLADVLAAGKACLLTCTKFPTVAEWARHLSPVVAPVAADLRVLGADERAVYVHAEAMHYDAAPCGCEDCRDAGVTDRPLRFVPDEGHGGLDRALDLDRNRIVVTGHWVHGDELARWYVARDRFFACAPRRSPLGRALVALVSREPGEEG